MKWIMEFLWLGSFVVIAAIFLGEPVNLSDEQISRLSAGHNLSRKSEFSSRDLKNWTGESNWRRELRHQIRTK